MTRTQIQLPTDLHRRAKRFAEKREMSLAELMRRGLELWLDRYPDEESARQRWTLPVANGGGLKVPLAKLHEIASEEEALRGLGRD